MFCPNCGGEDRDDSKFCKRCGTNLRVITLALAGKPVDSDDDAFVRRLTIQQELINQQNLLKKRQGMLTGGIIAACSGLGMMVFLTSMEGIKAGMIGMVPLMVGVGLILSAWLLFKPKTYPGPLIRATTETGPQVETQSQPAQLSYPESVTTEATQRFEGIKPPPRMTE